VSLIPLHNYEDERSDVILMRIFEVIEARLGLSAGCSS